LVPCDSFFVLHCSFSRAQKITSLLSFSFSFSSSFSQILVGARQKPLEDTFFLCWSTFNFFVWPQGVAVHRSSTSSAVRIAGRLQLRPPCKVPRIATPPSFVSLPTGKRTKVRAPANDILDLGERLLLPLDFAFEPIAAIPASCTNKVLNTSKL
jgi:hypothetical protein